MTIVNSVLYFGAILYLFITALSLLCAIADKRHDKKVELTVTAIRTAILAAAFFKIWSL